MDYKSVLHLVEKEDLVFFLAKAFVVDEEAKLDGKYSKTDSESSLKACICRHAIRGIL